MAGTGKRFKAEQIVKMLREIDVNTANREATRRSLPTDRYPRTNLRPLVHVGLLGLKSFSNLNFTPAATTQRGGRLDDYHSM